ncbi:hypothetical protein GSI_09015 [Ganoderma sinense ZZ0214-1]|uniref:Uncharacterized protein n=1 Tax=Ganoderma sinense ZZ0214-1 TaxID=1077348 RepID=A0A2G8S605_9APHY|nr:hypothetical protein GSI_09015 [Ganoderma sinense ZZ0214-1]
MSQPLQGSAVSAVRASTSALRTSTRATHWRASSRRMSSVAAYPIEEPNSPSFDLNILDIFDAPSRLGESSRLLVSNAAASSTIRRARLPTQVSPHRHVVKPLPEPVVLDGPARPRHAPFVSFRAFNNAVPRRNVNVSSGAWSPPAPLPTPILFDGPSQLRPYTRGGARWNRYSPSSLAMSAAPIVLALAAGVALFAVDVTSAAPRKSPRPDSDADSTSLSPTSRRGRRARDRLSFED